jgi:diaminohydroxyphosphoribosylaminopyrimidine deaminase/5-amino-6-(5-phosphoribosylamino)uracil reductase
MQRAIELAASAGGWVNPNPQVGAVLVAQGCVIGEGYHERFGGLHAERNAIAAAHAAGKATEGATLYVTLEPCCHHGKTPPCTDAIIEAGIAKVIIGSHDPNPDVAGKGIVQLRRAGIELVEGFMRNECDALNRIFFHYVTTKTPYVLMKYAMTLDGKIATHTGASRWITRETARADVHRLRGRYAAIMVGIGTVLADDSLLNCRSTGGHNPLRIVCDSNLRIPLDSRIVQTATEYETLIVACADAAQHTAAKAAQLAESSCEVLYVPAQAQDSAAAVGAATNGADAKSSHTGIDLSYVMHHLGARGIDSVLIEGGPTLNASALEAGCVHKLRCYIAPKLFGGVSAPSPIAGTGIALPDTACHLRNTSVELLGADFCIEGDCVHESSGAELHHANGIPCDNAQVPHARNETVGGAAQQDAVQQEGEV